MLDHEPAGCNTCGTHGLLTLYTVTAGVFIDGGDDIGPEVVSHFTACMDCASTRTFRELIDSGYTPATHEGPAIADADDEWAEADAYWAGLSEAEIDAAEAEALSRPVYASIDDIPE